MENNITQSEILESNPTVTTGAAAEPPLAPSNCYPADLVAHIEDEAKQFFECALRHERLGNDSAAAVAYRAHTILTRIAAEMKQDRER